MKPASLWRGGWRSEHHLLGLFKKNNKTASGNCHRRFSSAWWERERQKGRSQREGRAGSLTRSTTHLRDARPRSSSSLHFRAPLHRAAQRDVTSSRGEVGFGRRTGRRFSPSALSVSANASPKSLNVLPGGRPALTSSCRRHSTPVTSVK